MDTAGAIGRARECRFRTRGALDLVDVRRLDSASSLPRKVRAAVAGKAHRFNRERSDHVLHDRDHPYLVRVCLHDRRYRCACHFW